jgi:(2R)-3-sulfolactate dehydrogenase (NADP+)
MIAQKKGEAIPEGWALDAEGRPTTDAAAAMRAR